MLFSYHLGSRGRQTQSSIQTRMVSSVTGSLLADVERGSDACLWVGPLWSDRDTLYSEVNMSTKRDHAHARTLRVPHLRCSHTAWPPQGYFYSGSPNVQITNSLQSWKCVRLSEARYWSKERCSVLFCVGICVGLPNRSLKYGFGK